MFVASVLEVLMFTFRITAASALIEWPDDQKWPIALGELGVVRPLWDPSPFADGHRGWMCEGCTKQVIY